MPKVVVYVPAAAWKKLEAQGLDPAVAVRDFARRGYELVDGRLSEGGEMAGVAGASPVAVEKPRPSATPSSENRPKKRLHPCKHHVPPSRHCEYCDV